MTTIFLTSVRCQYPTAYDLLRSAVEDTAFWRDALAAIRLDAGTVQAFADLCRGAFVHERVERDPIPKATYQNTIDDFETLVRILSSGADASPERPLYDELVAWLDGAGHRPGSVSIEINAQQHRDDCKRLAAMVDARSAQRRARLCVAQSSVCQHAGAIDLRSACTQ
jgi:hypothetical protein